MKSDYIASANKVYFNLKEYEDILQKEIQVINYVKCRLLRDEALEDFCVDGVAVAIYGKGDVYDLYFDVYRLRIAVYEKQIVSSVLERS